MVTGRYVGICDHPPFSRSEADEIKFAKARAMEAHDGAALAGEHSFHLMIAALGDFEPGFARAEDFEFRRKAWLVLAFEHECAAGEQLDESGRQVGAHGDFVEFWDFVFG